MSRSAPRRLLVGALLLLATTVITAVPVGAHTGFESSEPTDGANADAPVDSITLTFSGPAEPAGEGFVVLDPLLGERTPDSIEQVSEGVYVLGLDPPLEGGTVGVRWSVRAPDAHPIDGAFRFSTPVADVNGGASQTADEGRDLDAFLATDTTAPAGQTAGDIGRFLAMGGTMVALGFLVFSLTVMRGSRSELRMLLFWMRRAGVVVAVGTVLDALGQVAFQEGGFDALVRPSAYTTVLSGTVGVSLLVRFVGACIVATRADLVMVHAKHARDPLRPVSAAIPIGAGSTRVADNPHDQWRPYDLAWELDRRGAVAVAGFVLVVLSHVIDGHTASEGSRWLMGVASSVHVFAAAIWAGGVAALALVIRRRSNRDEPTHALVMVTRYSIVATIGLAAVAVAGVYLAFVILDAPSELWSTDWGRVFLAKFVVVAVAAALGAHNHHVIVPALERSEEDPEVVSRLRSTLRNEVVTLTVVTVLTAILVRSASTL
ncbi:MAG: CopD family protein [Acidimicrobiales bacterium]|nr:CopD family protein [Acidimicrobiales bacterium]